MEDDIKVAKSVVAELQVTKEGNLVILTVESVDGKPITPQQVLDAAVECFEHTTYESMDDLGLN